MEERETIRSPKAHLLIHTGKRAFGYLVGVCRWLMFALVFVQGAVVLARYVFGANFLWGQELALALHGSIVMLAIAPALLFNRHVRIDALSTRWDEARRRKIEIFGTVFLLFPMAVAIVVTSVPYAVESWQILEGSAEISGLPGRFLLKTLIPLMAVLALGAALLRLVARR